ncbi:HNH endonuclease [Sporosarcina sp. E16_8]|uniref:HNH endonuclease n=1 Tax=Sporosarcina sp. E16_8 TaxID=2789295 RepID=UPI0021037601|nr:HNH endonuclease [Sporosarcina sp. E16_8]
MITDKRETELINFIRQDKLMKFYKSKEWFAVREQARRRDNYECQVCKSKGRYKRVQNVHHLKEVKTHPHLSLKLNNLQSLCIPCHNDAHERLKDVVEKKFMNVERW